MKLHDAVGVNGKKGGMTENQGEGAWYMGLRSVCWKIVWV